MSLSTVVIKINDGTFEIFIVLITTVSFGHEQVRPFDVYINVMNSNYTCPLYNIDTKEKKK